MVVLRKKMKHNIQTINTIIFDLGGVLIDWNPRYVYRTIFDSEEEVEWFLNNVCTSEWNERQDEGYLLVKATEELIAKFPEWEKEISAYYGRWIEMLGGPIEETVEIFRQLKKNTALKIYALTNWSAELFPIALDRYDFLHWFDGRVVSGEEKTRKPFPEFYQILLDRYSIDPGHAVFIDDNLRNIKGGEEEGITGIHFQNSRLLVTSLNEMEIL